mmetsp:Transcript_100050/g.229675  ORF Transcript_100050/g.229675 Transcript_100050/m.229675 type:complete len:83 (-) Transcript_100050:32-280(-)
MFRALRGAAKRSLEASKRENAFREREEEDAETASLDSARESDRIIAVIQRQQQIVDSRSSPVEDADKALQQLQNSFFAGSLD